MAFLLAALTWDLLCLIVLWTVCIEVLGAYGIVIAAGVTVMAVTKALLWPARRRQPPIG